MLWLRRLRGEYEALVPSTWMLAVNLPSRAPRYYGSMCGGSRKQAQKRPSISPWTPVPDRDTYQRFHIGNIEAQWMTSHLTAQQAADADLPAGYQAGNAEVVTSWAGCSGGS
eukprot:3049155-Amphidinium_carterae.1